MREISGLLRYSAFARNTEEKVGMWVMLDATTLLTSAHGIENEMNQYGIKEGKERRIFTLVERDKIADTAILTASESRKSTWKLPLFHRDNLVTWDPVYTLVARSGSLERIDGTLRAMNAQTLSYTPRWQVSMLSWITLTDLSVEPWDSGAPLFSADWYLIDIVHVRGE
jgi:S1-C subfamily serine protease